MKTIKGTSNRYLDINLSDSSWSVYHVSAADLRDFLGAKGVALKIFHDRFSRDKLAQIDPLGADNLLIFSMGVMLSTGAPCSGRFEVVTKSPLTGLMVGSSCGGYFGEACKTAGWDGVIISGSASEPTVIKIDKDGVLFEEAGELWGQGTHEVQKNLNLSPKEGAAVIGPAGENKVLYANICSGHRFAGRGGVGAVMGAKNLKAVVARGKEVSYEPVRPGLFQKTIAKSKKYVHRNGMTESYRLYGTNANVRFGIKTGFSPVRNFRDRWHEDTEKTSGEAMAEKYGTRHSACRHCSVLCGHKGRYPDGKMRQIPEYETIGMFGSNIENFDPDKIGVWNEEMNELGLDTISAGGTMAWAMEAAEKGIRSSQLQFGRHDNISSVLKDIAYRKGEGAELADGSKKLSEKYGGTDFAIHVKGIEVAAYDPRASWGHGLGYAVHNKGGCHLGSYLISLEQLMGYMPPHTTMGKAHWVVFMEDMFSAVNSLQVCLFSVFGIMTEPVIPKYLPKFVLNIATIAMPKVAMMLMDWSILSEYFTSVTGIKLSKWGFVKAGERINKLERWLNVQMGMTPDQDTLPDRFTKEKETAYKGKNTVVPLDRMIRRYYRLRRYNDTAGPEDKVIDKMMARENRSRTVSPYRSPVKLIYCGTVMAVLGWFIPAVACRKASVRDEVKALPEDFKLRFAIWPSGPSLSLKREGDRLKKVSLREEQADMTVYLKSLEAAWLLLTFQESTCDSEARGRLMVKGDLPHTCTFIRLMDKVEILLLPRFLAKRAVKKWEPVR
ncbi:aldehyde ferredoxin oxidoreductase C-terminal domain-containing protein [Spirochaeta isovalerica]|uniref:Aldehyde:ferredoxin oxidoreductase n=1 Tax=Spirochaeta isovalerica TaxID=150 RepID=A0A841R636_9SPIO|nr:aldehyde:ferredoxin oxidoreductase [Spirochaeta isovalerica]